MLLVDEVTAQLFVRNVEHHADHQAAATHFGDMGLGLLQLAKLLDEVFAHLMRIVYQVLVLVHVEHGQGGGAAEMVASEGGAQLPVDWFEVGRDEQSAHGIAVGNALGHGDEVGLDAQPLVGKELSAAPVATLYLVSDEYRAVFLAGGGKPLGKLGGGHHASADALDTLQDHGANVTLGQFALPRLKVVHRQEGDMAVGIDGCHDLGVAGDLDSQRCAAVEGMVG